MVRTALPRVRVAHGLMHQVRQLHPQRLVALIDERANLAFCDCGSAGVDPEPLPPSIISWLSLSLTDNNDRAAWSASTGRFRFFRTICVRNLPSLRTLFGRRHFTPDSAPPVWGVGRIVFPGYAA